MKTSPITHAEFCHIMADLHDRLNRIGSANGGFKAYKGICVQLAIAASSDPSCASDIQNYRMKRQQVLSDLMRGWARRNPSLGRGAKRGKYNLQYPIFPWSPNAMRLPANIEDAEATRLFSKVIQWGSHVDEPTIASTTWPPTKPEGYEEFIVARLNLLAYLQDTVARVVASHAVQEVAA